MSPPINLVSNDKIIQEYMGTTFTELYADATENRIWELENAIEAVITRFDGLISHFESLEKTGIENIEDQYKIFEDLKWIYKTLTETLIGE